VICSRPSSNTNHKYRIMRSDDIANVTIMRRPMDDGSIRVTIQSPDGIDIAHAFYRKVGDQLLPSMSWVSERWNRHAIQDQMDAIAAGDTQLDEVSIGKLAKAAAVGAGVLGSAYLAKGMTPPTQLTSPLAVTQPAVTQPAVATKAAVPRDEDPMAKAAAVAKSAEPAPKITPINTEQKVMQFLDTMVPLVRAENDRITRERQGVIRLVSKIHRGNGLDPKETEYLQGMMDRYGTRDPMELLNKVDVIPASMAVAQAAVESGWGQDALAQKANVIFGQKTWDKDAGVEGPAGERYAAFSSPADSVRAYMQNLNTHPAYEKFRDARASLRAKNKPVTGQALLPTMTKYSTLGKDYVSKVNKVIKGRNLHKLDR